MPWPTPVRWTNQIIALISKYYDARQIRLSGVGVGREFNDSLLAQADRTG